MLVVDDHPQVREAVRALLLTEPGIQVVGEATTGDEALGVALVLRPDLIVLDHEMPGTSGLDILPKLRVILPAARIVMFTLSPGIAGRARSRGADAVVSKDDPAALVAAIRRSAAALTAAGPVAAPPPAAIRGRPWWIPASLLAAVVVLYVVSFVPLVGWLGSQTPDIAILLVAAAGGLYGLRAGLVAAVLAFPLNALLIRLAGVPVPEAGSASRALIALAIGAAAGQLRDVTARANAQARSLSDTGAALEASDRRLFGLVQDAPVLLVSIDTSGVIVDALGAGFGDDERFSPERMRGQQAAVFYAGEPELLARLSRALTGDDFGERVQRPDVAYYVHFRPRRDASGGLVGTTAAFVKIS